MNTILGDSEYMKIQLTKIILHSLGRLSVTRSNMPKSKDQFKFVIYSAGCSITKTRIVTQCFQAFDCVVISTVNNWGIQRFLQLLYAGYPVKG